MFESLINYVRVVVPTSMESVLLAIGAAVGTWISIGVGGFDDSFVVLCMFMLADILTGSRAAWKRGKFKTKIAAQGFFKKIFVVFAVMLCEGVDVALHVNFMRDACVMAYVVIEALSICENVDRLGYGKLIPPFIRRGLEQVRDQKQARFGGKVNADTSSTQE